MSDANRASLFDRPLPPGYREELRLMVDSEPAKAVVRAGSILLFQLGPLRLALSSRVAAAVGPVLHVARIPHRSGTVLLGLVAFRGEILPCCSLARLLDVTQSQSGAARTLILEESPGRRWAVPIDAVLGIRPTPEQFEAFPGRFCACPTVASRKICRRDRRIRPAGQRQLFSARSPWQRRSP